MPALSTRALAVFCFTALLSLPGFAHEFWLEPLDYRAEAGDKVRAHIKVGQYFKGNTYAYFPHRFDTFNLMIQSQSEPVNARLGSIPAVSQNVEKPGLAVLAYESNYEELTYNDAEVFQTFLELDGLEWIKQRHQERGLPAEGFTEVYRRFAKAYIGIGHGRGQDRTFGFPLEWVLNANPYQLAAGKPLPAQLLWQGDPFADSLVRVFIRSGNQEVEELRLRTDEEGRIQLPYHADTEYLVSSVHMVEPGEGIKEQTGAVWESLWASAVFYRE